MSDDYKQSYPLHWPEGWARTPAGKRRKAPFQITEVQAREQLLEEIRRLGGKAPIISTNVSIYQRRGVWVPYANQPTPEDPGVAVYWTTRDGEQRVIACDRWLTVRENIRAIGLSINAIRSLDRWGSSSMLDHAFRGFAALPPAGPDSLPSSHRAWWEVLETPWDAPLEFIEDRYRRLARVFHPDRPNGSTERMAELNLAIAEARAERAES